ncbi:MAG: type 4a pilus biogenesis protein PilO [Candidatus Omnitrophota bacterium]|jgi:Tfp pilus assembly protein PilO
MIKLSGTQKILAYVAGAIVLVFLLSKFSLFNFASKSRGLQQQIRVEEEKLKEALEIQKDKDSILQDYNKYSPYLDSLLSDDENTAQFVKQIEKLSQESGVSIISLNPENKPQPFKEYKKMKADLRLEATMEQLVSFLSRIQDDKLLIRLESLSITPKDEYASSLRVEAAISVAIP